MARDPLETLRPIWVVAAIVKLNELLSMIECLFNNGDYHKLISFSRLAWEVLYLFCHWNHSCHEYILFTCPKKISQINMHLAFWEELCISSRAGGQCETLWWGDEIMRVACHQWQYSLKLCNVSDFSRFCVFSFVHYKPSNFTFLYYIYHERVKPLRCHPISPFLLQTVPPRYLSQSWKVGLTLP